MDRIAQEYRRLAGDQVRTSVGFHNIPNVTKYVQIIRNDLPILTEPSITAANLSIVGLAQKGEYFPVLEERETMVTLSGGGETWCKIKTSSDQVGWIVSRPGIGQNPFGQITQQTLPEPNRMVSGQAQLNSNAPSPKKDGWFIDVGTIVIVLLVFILGFAYKIKALNDPATLGELITLRFDGYGLKCERNVLACKAYPTENLFAIAAVMLGAAWLWIVWNVPFLATYASSGWMVDSLVFGGLLIWALVKWYPKLLQSVLSERVNAAERSFTRATKVGSWEREVIATSARMNFVFPVTWSSEFDSYIQKNKATVIANLRQLEQRITDLTSDAQQTLTSLKQAEWDLDQAKDTYGDCLRVVTKSGSIALIQALEKIHAYLNTTALTEFLAARRWQDFKEAVDEAIKEMEHLSEVAKDYQDSGREKNGSTIPETGMLRERALKILGLKDGCRPEDVKRAWREECKKWNIDQRQNYEPHILEKIQEQFKEVNEAKEILLGKT